MHIIIFIIISFHCWIVLCILYMLHILFFGSLSVYVKLYACRMFFSIKGYLTWLATCGRKRFNAPMFLGSNCLACMQKRPANSTIPPIRDAPVYDISTQHVAELLRFKYVQFWHHPPSWIWPKVDFHTSLSQRTHNAPACQISTELGHESLSNYRFKTFAFRMAVFQEAKP